jgi:hypothetical protein
LTEAAGARPQVLREAGIDEMSWLEVEKTWLLRIAVSLMRGETALATEFDELHSRAQDALGSGDRPRSVEEYAEIVARIERGAEPSQVLAAQGLTPPAWARLQRGWTKRLAADPAMLEHFRELVARGGPK